MATKAVFVAAQWPNKLLGSYATQLARITIELPFCFRRWGIAYCIKKNVALQLIQNISCICCSLALRQGPNWFETAALGTKQSILPYFFKVSLIKLVLYSLLPTLQTIPQASYPLDVSSLTVSSMCLRSLLEIMTLTPYLAKDQAMAFPIPVEDAVIIATFPFISINIKSPSASHSLSNTKKDSNQ